MYAPNGDVSHHTSRTAMNVSVRWSSVNLVAFPGVLERCRNGGGLLARYARSSPDDGETLDALLGKLV